MGEKVSWYPLTKIVQITQAPVDIGGEDQVNFNVKTDLYSDGKEDWVASGELSKFIFPVGAVGGQDLPGEKLLGSTYFLNYGWRIRPYEESHVFNVNGNLYTDTGDSPFTQTLGSYNVMTIQQVSSLVDSTVAQLSEIEYMAFGGFVSIDSISGESGTVYPLGTEEYPVSNWNDAEIIGQEKGINKFKVCGNLNIDGNLTNKYITGLSPTSCLINLLSGANTTNSFFEKAYLSGEFSGANSVVRDCYIGEITDYDGLIDYSFLVGPIGLKNQGTINLLNCFDGVIGDDLPVVDINGTNKYLSVHNYHGSIKLINKTGQDPIEVRLQNGVVVLDSTIISGEILIEGAGRYVDNSTGNVNLDVSGLLNPTRIIEDLWDDESGRTLAYGGVIIIDSLSGEAGIDFPIGTRSNPSNNLTDALVISENNSIVNFLLRSPVTIEATNNVTKKIFDAQGIQGAGIVFEDGCSTDFSTYRYGNVSGVLQNGDRLLIESCTVGNLVNFTGHMNIVVFDQGSEISIGQWANLISCTAGGEPNNEPEIDIGISELLISKWTGNLKLKGKTGSNRTVVNMHSGNVIVDSTCVAGTIQLLGNGQLERDESGPGCTVDIDAMLSNENIADHVLDEPIAEHLDSGSFGESVFKMLGLSQENYYLDQTVYTTYNSVKLMTSGRLRTYTNPASVGTVNDILATYTITAVWNNDELQNYKVVKV